MATLSATGSGGVNVANVEKITTFLGSEDIVCLQSGCYRLASTENENLLLWFNKRN